MFANSNPIKMVESKMQYKMVQKNEAGNKKACIYCWQ